MFENDFGRGSRMRLPVEIKCCKRNLDICDICNQKPIGDYWHLNNRKFLCRPCMINERRKSAKYKMEKLKNYRVIKRKKKEIFKLYQLYNFVSINFTLFYV